MLNSPNTLPSFAKMLIIGFLANQRMCKDICPCRDSPYIDEILSVKFKTKILEGEPSPRGWRPLAMPSPSPSSRCPLAIPSMSLDTENIIGEKNRQLGKYQLSCIFKFQNLCNHRDMIKTNFTAL